MRVYLVAAMSATTIQKTNRSRLVFFLLANNVGF